MAAPRRHARPGRASRSLAVASWIPAFAGMTNGSGNDDQAVLHGNDGEATAQGCDFGPVAGTEATTSRSCSHT